MPAEQKPSPAPAPPSTTHRTPRATLFATIFWEVLPSHYTTIATRSHQIANLHSQAHTSLLATDRAAALDSLKAELDMLDHDLTAYRNIVRGIDITDVAGLYVVAGWSPHRALQLARRDFEGLERSLEGVREMVGEWRAGVKYGVGEER